jgi:hypothetical protein
MQVCELRKTLHDASAFTLFLGLLMPVAKPVDHVNDDASTSATAAVAAYCVAFHNPCNPAGDHALTGLAIGKMLGISGNDSVITGPEIDAMDDVQLRGVVNSCNIFARASPENKLRIVRALQTGPAYEGPMDGDDPGEQDLGNNCCCLGF